MSWSAVAPPPLDVQLAMRNRLNSERGMTLPEVLVTMTIALVLSLATFALVDMTIRRTGEITARVDGVQRGRVAMDLMTRQLRSQVCLGPRRRRRPRSSRPPRPRSPSTSSMGDPSTKAARLGEATATPLVAEKRADARDHESYAPARSIERRWVGTPSTVALGYSFPTDSDVDARAARARRADADAEQGPTPLHSSASTRGTRTRGPTLDVLLPVPTLTGLSDADAKVAQIRITFGAPAVRAPTAGPRPTSTTTSSCAPSTPTARRES